MSRPGRQHRKPAPIDAGLLALALMAACAGPPAARLATASGEVMGTRYNVSWVAASPDVPAAADVEQAVAAQLHAVDDLMTTYRDSEVTRFNAWRSGEPFAVSTPTAQVVALALDLARETGGALDITIAPLVTALGFGPQEAAPGLPSDAELAALWARVGYHRLSVDAEGRLVKSLPALEIDLSSVAKGFAVDQAAAALDGLGIANYLVEVGGEVRARGVNLQSEPWRIGIERPDTESRRAERIIPLADLAMATSGDYRNYRQVDGRRISHIIDPRSGAPIDHRVASASVLHRECATADGLATAMMVLGEDGLALAAARDWAVLLLVREGDGFVELESPAFRRLLESTVRDDA
jgi:FAD:protein FMN transferase